MIFTLYYTYATIIQWWRLRALRNKLNGTLNNQNALLVCSGYKLHDSRKQRSLENLLFTTESRIVCTVVPKQKVNLNQWIAFPKNLRYFPIHIQDNKPQIGPDPIFILLQSVLDTYTKHQGNIIQVENFGELLGWKAADTFEVVLKTNIEKLTQLIQYFSQSEVDINHELRILKIETVDIEGAATSIKYEKKYLKEQTLKYSYAPVHWNKFVSEVKDLYSKIRDVTNPRIKIENGSTKCFVEAVAAPKIVKKDSKNSLEVKKEAKKVSEDKNTLEVSSGGDHRRHKHADHGSKVEKKSKEVKDVVKSKVEANGSNTVEKRSNNKTKATESTAGSTIEKNKGKDAREAEPSGSNTVENGSKNIGSKTKIETTDTIDKKGKDVREVIRPKAETSNVKVKTGKTKIEAKVNKEKSGTKKLTKQSTVKENPTVTVAEVDPKNNAESKSEGNKETKSEPVKPPNVLVYADSVLTKNNVKRVLYSILNKEKYTIYDLPTSSKQTFWNTSTVLVVVCGSVPPELTSHLIQYLLSGGQLLCLCSDLMYSVLHTFTTAEVREHELVRFSYGTWERVKMMHHIFCYQASPAKKQFSKDSDQSNHSSNGSSPIAHRPPTNVELRFNDKDYNIQVQVLGTEETWQTPSLLLAKVKGSQGRAVFSQVHLEIDPEEYENDEDEEKYKSLRSSNEARLQILKDILSNHLELECDEGSHNVQYTPGYFLGRFDAKMSIMSNCDSIDSNQLVCEKINVVFCGHNVDPGQASDIRLPVMIHSCPSNFSTLDYFETLNTEDIGRLVIYSDILTSSQNLLARKLRHGLVVIPKQQTSAVGRSNNSWISPVGCAAFSLQMHIPLKTNLGTCLPLVQHLVMVAIVAAIKNLEGYENINLRIKWPNDLYANSKVKIGGIAVNSLLTSGLAIVNIGCGVNLSNQNPTTCINDLIEKYNKKNGTSLKPISYETFFAIVFNELERLYLDVQRNGFESFFGLYYKHWLHSDAEVTIQTENGDAIEAKVTGIDDYGFLTVQTSDGNVTSVQPDGNSFDMMRGLIAPKKF